MDSPDLKSVIAFRAILSKCWAFIDTARGISVQDQQPISRDDGIFEGKREKEEGLGEESSARGGRPGRKGTAATGAVLVHCLHGVSRSGGVVISYVMKTQHMDFLSAWKFCKSRRSVIHPNEGFKHTLQELQFSSIVSLSSGSPSLTSSSTSTPLLPPSGSTNATYPSTSSTFQRGPSKKGPICGRFPSMPICGCTIPCLTALKEVTVDEIMLPEGSVPHFCDLSSFDSSPSSSSFLCPTSSTSSLSNSLSASLTTSSTSPLLVKSGIFIGPVQAAFKEQLLHSLGIDAVVDLSGSKYTERDGFTYLHVSVKDDPSQDLRNTFIKTCKFVEPFLSRGSGVLVHCQAGKSRSAAVVGALLIARYGLLADEALKIIRRCHPRSDPNHSFCLQLKHWQEDVLKIQIKKRSSYVYLAASENNINMKKNRGA